jgi:hypothetical protein
LDTAGSEILKRAEVLLTCDDKSEGIMENSIEDADVKRFFNLNFVNGDPEAGANIADPTC